MDKQVPNIAIFVFMVLWAFIAGVSGLVTIGSINDKSKAVNEEWKSMVASYDSRMDLLMEMSNIEVIKTSNPSFASSMNDLHAMASDLKIDKDYNATEVSHAKKYDEIQKDISAISRSFISWLNQNRDIGKVKEVAELKDKILKEDSDSSIYRARLIEKISAYNKYLDENKTMQKRHGFKTKPDFSKDS